MDSQNIQNQVHQKVQKKQQSQQPKQDIPASNNQIKEQTKQQIQYNEKQQKLQNTIKMNIQGQSNKKQQQKKQQQFKKQQGNKKSLKKPTQQQYNQALAYLLQFGFQQKHIKMALNYTIDRQKAAQIVVKILQQGQDVDLSQYKIQKQKKILKQKPNKPKMLFVVNGQLKMGKGKICAQVGHAVIGAYLQIQQISKFDNKAKYVLDAWQYLGGAKIVVKAQNLKEMMDVKKLLDQKEINNYLVQDAGHTQIKAGSKTVLGIGPAFSQDIDPITQHLKLL